MSKSSGAAATRREAVVLHTVDLRQYTRIGRMFRLECEFGWGGDVKVLQRMGVVLGAIFAVALACSAAAAMEASPPVAAQAGLGIVVEIQPMVAARQRRVGLLRPHRRGWGLDLLTLYASNFRRGDRVYLLNIPPGRYAALAAVFRVGFIGPASTYVTYFPGPVIEKSTVEGVERQVSYAGRYVLGTGVGVCGDKADPLQARAAEAISAGPCQVRARRHGAARDRQQARRDHRRQRVALGPSTYHYRGIERTSSNEAGDRRDFFNSAQQELGFAGSGADCLERGPRRPDIQGGPSGEGRCHARASQGLTGRGYWRHRTAVCWQSDATVQGRWLAVSNAAFAVVHGGSAIAHARPLPIHRSPLPARRY